MRGNPGLVRLGKSLGWPKHQMAERQALQQQEMTDDIVQLLEDNDGGGDGETECPLKLENKSRQEVEEDLLSFTDEGENNQRGEEKESKKGSKKEGVWQKMLYMITNYPGPASIHSPVKVNYPDDPLERIHFLCPGDHGGSLLSITPAWRLLFHGHAWRAYQDVGVGYTRPPLESVGGSRGAGNMLL